MMLKSKLQPQHQCRRCSGASKTAAAALAAAQRRRTACSSSNNNSGGGTNGTATATVAAGATPTLRAPDWPRGVHSVRMEVRDSELDQFSVVNNAVYSAYFQHGRHAALKSMGAGVGEYQAAGVLMALSELVVRFKQPLRSGDVFRVETSIGAVTAARLVMKQAVVREAGGGEPEALCAEGTATVVAIDANHRPIRWPAKDRQVFAALQEAAAEAALG